MVKRPPKEHLARKRTQLRHNIKTFQRQELSLYHQLLLCACCCLSIDNNFHVINLSSEESALLCVFVFMEAILAFLIKARVILF